MTDLIDKLFGKAIRRRIHEGYYRPKGFDGMAHAFVDDDGRAYYAYPDVSAMPAVRIKEIEGLMLWADAGVSKPSMDAFCTAIEEQAMTVLKTSDNKAKASGIARIMKLTEELKMRGKDVIPEEIYYQIAALCVAREDEDPRKVDDQVQRQKAAMLRQAGRAGADFFTRMPAFSALLAASLTTEAALLHLLGRWTLHRQREQVLTQGASGQPSGSTTGSSMSSPTASQGGSQANTNG